MYHIYRNVPAGSIVHAAMCVSCVLNVRRVRALAYSLNPV